MDGSNFSTLGATLYSLGFSCNPLRPAAAVALPPPPVSKAPHTSRGGLSTAQAIRQAAAKRIVQTDQLRAFAAKGNARSDGYEAALQTIELVASCLFPTLGFSLQTTGAGDSGTASRRRAGIASFHVTPHMNPAERCGGQVDCRTDIACPVLCQISADRNGVLTDIQVIRFATTPVPLAGPQVAPDQSGQNRAAFPGLTQRQNQIMALVLDGQPSKNIAADLGISQRTVENHRSAIMLRTGATSLPALARIAAGLAHQNDFR